MWAVDGTPRLPSLSGCIKKDGEGWRHRQQWIRARLSLPSVLLLLQVPKRRRVLPESRTRDTMLEGKAMVEDTDMPAKMQAQAMAAASRALDRFDVLDCRSIAAHIKKVTIPSGSGPRAQQLGSGCCINSASKSEICVLSQRVGGKPCSIVIAWIVGLLQEFDTIHGPGWQCVVGSSFGCYFTHSKGSFIYFRLESLRFLIFKGAAA